MAGNSARVGVVIALLLAGCAGGNQAVPAKDYEALGTAKCAYGPWSRHCPSAFWVRDVIAAAGWRIDGDTGAAFESNGVHVWAADAAGPQDMEKLDEVSGVPIYGDRVRLVWQVHGLNVWTSLTVPGDIDPGHIADLVEASKGIPYP